MAFRRRGNYARRSASAIKPRRGANNILNRLNWGSVGIAVAALALIALSVVFLVRGCSAPASVTDPPTSPSPTTAPTPDHSAPGATPIAQDGSTEERAIDLSRETITVASQERNINHPGIYGDEMVYAAGSGPVSEPVFTKLYYLNLKTMEEEQLASVTVPNGEIYETAINEDYIVWIDTNQIGSDKGQNSIYVLDRYPNEDLGELPPLDDDGTIANITPTPGPDDASPSPGAPSPTPSAAASPSAGASASPDADSSDVVEGNPEPFLIKENQYHMPALKLFRDYLIWTEQDSEKIESLYMFDLLNQEDVALPAYTESIEGFETTYSVSAPDIYGTEVIWAAPDRDDPNDRNSVIYSCLIDRLREDDYQPVAWKADMYVHAPITNGRAWAWIDKNREPVQNLFIKYGDEVRLVSAGTLEAPITSHCFGDDMLIYAKNDRIYVYFYETDQYGVVSAPGERGRQPVANGRRVAWFGTAVDGNDQLKVVYLP